MVTTRPSALNRKQRKELARRLQSADPGLEVMHPNAAGVDVGNSTHYVAVRPDRDPNPVRRFDCLLLIRLFQQTAICCDQPSSSSLSISRPPWIRR